jgi:hypothetical protein
MKSGCPAARYPRAAPQLAGREVGSPGAPHMDAGIVELVSALLIGFALLMTTAGSMFLAACALGGKRNG